MDEHLRMIESVLFAAAEPLDEQSIAARLPKDADVPALLETLRENYERRGVNLVYVAKKWMFRTAPDMAPLMEREKIVRRRLSRAAMETLAIIAYHQSVTRADIESIRGVSVSPGTMDTLLETGWVRIRGRRKTPGRPVVYGTTEAFLVHFDLEDVASLPGMDELKAAGLLDSRLPGDFQMPMPGQDDDEVLDPYEDEDEDGDEDAGVDLSESVKE